MDINYVILKAVFFMIPLILSLTVHEYAHARAAYLLGDDTAARMGRMTLNPIVHIDLVGTILIPLVVAISGGIPLIGWAKPVPVMPVKYTRKISMHLGDVIVSVAGPIANLLLALVAMFMLKVIFNPDSLWHMLVTPETRSPALFFGYMLSIIVVLNVGLCIFNLIPIPPLDGSHLLPRSLTPVLDKIMPFSYLILMGIVAFFYDWMMIPVKIILKIFSIMTGVAV